MLKVVDKLWKQNEKKEKKQNKHEKKPKKPKTKNYIHNKKRNIYKEIYSYIYTQTHDIHEYIEWRLCSRYSTTTTKTTTRHEKQCENVYSLWK